MNSNKVTIHKLQKAINTKYNQTILYNTQQFYSEKQKRPVTMYIIKQAVWDEEAGKHKNIELFSAFSMIQIVLFLRDMWYALEGREIPDDNEKWIQAKALYAEKHEANDIDVTLPDGKNERKHVVRKDAWDEVKK